MNRQFPALRGIAIFLVVINHSIILSIQAVSQYQLSKIPLLEKNILLAIKEIGVLAVPIFLFLAGAFMMYSLMNKSIREGYRVIIPTLKNAVIPYLVWSVLYYIVAYLMYQESYSLLGYVKNLLVGYPYNFVPILVFFILISPILSWLSRRYPVFLFVFFALYQIVLLNIQLPGSLGFVFPGWLSIIAPPVLSLPFTLWAIFYPFGMIYIQNAEKYKSIAKPLIPLIIIASLGLYILAALRETGIIKFQLAEWLLPIVTIFLLPFIKRKSIPLLPFFENLGKRSYGIYFMNLVIIKILVHLSANLFPAVYKVETVLVILLAAITIFTTTKLMAAIEKGSTRRYYRYIFG
jgi:peptidoglycan/LPS O-acetylase OafA/YrhL